jgi:hypothetical protein
LTIPASGGLWRRRLQAARSPSRRSSFPAGTTDKLRATLEQKQTREELEQLTGIKDTGALDTLIAMNVAKDTFAAFALYPLVEIAWADGEVDEKERKAFLAAAAEHGIAPGMPAHAALEGFVKRSRARCAQGLVVGGRAEPRLDARRGRKVREGLISGRAVAEARGPRPATRLEQRSVLDALRRRLGPIGPGSSARPRAGRSAAGRVEPLPPLPPRGAAATGAAGNGALAARGARLGFAFRLPDGAATPTWPAATTKSCCRATIRPIP